MDVQQALWRAENNGMSLDNLRGKVAEFVAAGALSEQHAAAFLRQIEANRGIVGDMADNPAASETGYNAAMLQQVPKTEQQLKQHLESILKQMEDNMQKTKHGHGKSDQWAVYRSFSSVSRVYFQQRCLFSLAFGRFRGRVCTDQTEYLVFKGPAIDRKKTPIRFVS